MPGANKPLTEREKIAIFAYIYGLIPDLKTAYICAENRAAEEVQKQTGIKTSVSRWANGEKFRRYAEYCKRYIQDKEAEAVQRGKDEARHEQMQEERGTRESEHTETNQSRRNNKIDYNDPKARKDLYNRIIAEAQDDPKTQLDAAKLIEQTQREDKQAARDNKIQRFYTPLSCRDCPLHEKAIQKHLKSTQ